MSPKSPKSPKSNSGHPKIIARACLLCRSRKIRCDTARPRCTACASQNRECVYHFETPRKRPTLAQINELQQERTSLKSFIAALKKASTEERDVLLSSTSIESVRFEAPPEEASQYSKALIEGNYSRQSPRRGSLMSVIDSDDEDLDVTQFISIDEAGNPSTFGPSSALHVPTNGEQVLPSAKSQTLEHRKNSLIANAALQRQSEHEFSRFTDIAGVPIQLALHLLNVHWSRQHHTFLLTYRPAIMRDLKTGGPYSSPFLLNAIFACSSKFSEEMQHQDNPFFVTCDRLIAEQGLLMNPSIPTVVGLVLLGSTYNARGDISKSWLFTGYALRMAYDLGLHLDPQETTDNAEDIEIRRRVFWGIFICDKLQSLYLGRPVGLHLRDTRVSRDFLDTFEENDVFVSSAPCSSPIYSVSVFRQMCSLSKIMAVIIDRFYVVGATFSNAHSSLQMLDFQVQGENPGSYPAPNVMNLHGIYHSLIILLHRPFISDGHLRSRTVPQHSWVHCTTAAQMISHIAESYKAAYGLSKAPYILSYAIYVACTIHVRNAAGEVTGSYEHVSLLRAGLECLNIMCQANPGIRRPVSIIRRLIAANKINLDIGEFFRYPHAESII
ncbi:hypothetical protein N7510_010989 [Penicillium lagena]|uniref:uncharacterized protein n=1 Tax=Penicillium lagena TaxID=94218 RepID=UPI002540DE65|nr:uncharacterized protein N7510_010989 [Penicillium lagena]KAJ5601455.1 hypothetical protein N7510_010989 [Penicillium lagena]